MSSPEKIEINKLGLEKKSINSILSETTKKNVNLLRDSSTLNNSNNNNRETPEDGLGSSLDMPRVLRSRRRFCLILAGIGVICFLCGLGLPFLLFQQPGSSPSLPTRPPLPPSLDHAFGPLRFRRRGGLHRTASLLSSEAQTLLKDLYISVKTTKRYHFPRLVLLLETWVPLVKDQTWFFTDTLDPEMLERSGGHMILTNCSSAHSRTALACKMGVEFDHFLQSQRRWWCHFDDDNYVNIHRLAAILSSYPSDIPQYLGKPSTAKPLEVSDSKDPQGTSYFWFATGGAGFCVTRTMALKMAPYASGGKFIETGDKYWFPDDVTFGYIVEHLLGEHLTVVPEFHSHLESMKSIKEESLEHQITVSYINYNGVENVIDIQGPFSEDVDPTRFYSLHCRLYDAVYCPKTEIRR